MTTIATSYITNNLPLTNHNSIAIVKPGIASKISNLTRNLYLGPNYTNVPGVTNLISGPYDLYHSLSASLNAYAIGDKEGMIENGLRIAEAPFSLTNALLQLIWYSIHVGVFFKVISESFAVGLAPLSANIAGAGIAFSTIEGILETIGLGQAGHFLYNYYPSELEEFKKAFEIKDPQLRQKKFLDALNQLLKKDLPSSIKIEINNLLQKKESPTEFFQQIENILKQLEENVYLTHLERISNNYFRISPLKANKIEKYVQSTLSTLSAEEKLRRKEQIIEANLEKKRSRLIRRLQHRLTNELDQKLPGIIQDLQSPLPGKRAEATEKAAALFNDIRIQSYKKLLIHAVGLLAVGITLAGLIAGLIACPYLIPFALLLIGGGLAFVRYYLSLGLGETQGWHFDVNRCIPNFVKAIYRRIAQKKALSQVPSTTVLYFRLPQSEDRARELRLPKLDFTLSVARLRA